MPSIGYRVASLTGAFGHTVSVQRVSSLGWLPALSLIGALDLLLVSVAYTGSRAAAGWAEPLFWIGLLVLVMPITARLAFTAASRQERIGLVALLALALYLVKVIHSPYAFTFHDEFVHLRNVLELLQNHRLFHANTVLPVTPLYPGLETVTNALASLSGLSAFSAGLLVIGVARLVLALALFFFYEQIGGSARVAGIAAVLYMANSNFMFWSAQFSYESMALPLATMVLFAIARREGVRNGARSAGLTFSAVLVLLAVVISHHLSSYALVAFLCLVSIFQRGRATSERPGTWGIALIALAATLAWLVYVASLTIGYLSPVLGGAIRSIVELVIAEQETGRQLFQSSSGYVAPLWERVTGISSVLLLLLALPFGLLQIWRRHRHNPYALVLAGVGLTFFAAQGMRFTGAGWETANRASEFLFVGVSFVVALGAMESWMPRQSRGRLTGRSGGVARAAFSVYVAVIFLGGVIAGWQPNARLARPYLVAAGAASIEPQGVSAARWTHVHLGPHNRIAADRSNATLLLAYGDQYPYTGSARGTRQMMFSTQVSRSVQDILRITGVRYVAVDRRMISWDHMVGVYFNHRQDDFAEDKSWLDPEVLTKFDHQENVSRIFDSGNIVIYAVGDLVDGPTIE